MSEFIYDTIISDAFKKKQYKKVSAVVRGGKVVRREHMRRYGRELSGAVSASDLILRNLTKNNAFLEYLTRDGLG